MRKDTPPSSLNGDDIGMDDEGIVYLDEMEPLEGDFDGFMEEVVDEEDEDAMMEPAEDHAVVVLRKHVGSVFCCDFHPDGKLVATGGEDDKAFVWAVETGQEVMECSGHKDSVIFVGFSFDGAYLATADMSGVIKVWKCNLEDTTPWLLAFEYDEDELCFGLWHFGARVLICGSMTGLIYIFKIPSGETKILTGHSSKVECAKLFHDGVRLAVGYEDGIVKIWDIKTSTVLHQVSGGVHQIGVTALDIHPDDSVLASISTDGNVVVTRANNGKVVAQLQSDNDLETVAFQKEPQTGYLALGTLTGAVSIWDVVRQMVRHQCAKSDDKIGGVTKMLWVKDRLVTACLDGTIRVYESLTGEKSLTLTGHRSEILDMCYNAKQNLILTSSDDGTARIFKYETN